MIWEKVKDSLRVIRSVVEQSGKTLVLFSGGKDSLAVLLLALECGVNEAVYMDSSISLPHILEWNLDLCQQLGVRLHVVHPARHYQGDFAYHVRRWGYFPTINRTWCRIKLKVRPQRAYLRQLYGFTRIFKLCGVRKAESSRRQRIYRTMEVISADEEHRNGFLVQPILEWSDKDVDCFLKRQGVKANPYYKIYGVTDCKWCPFYQPSIYKRIAKIEPGIYDDIIALEEELGKPSVTGRLWLKDLVSV
ncbi:MAG: phosphoadenosine phosphosulfate reductase family protein [Candidatus Bathyarchaeia archaeon]